MERKEFVQQTYRAALQSSEHSGMPAMVTVAQAALESNWGQSKLSLEANNYFGIKAHGKHGRIQMCTEECGQGSRIVVQAEFAKYLSLLDCIYCRDGILLRGSCYAGARQMRRDEAGFIREIAKHWATDPKYAEKLQAVLNEVKALAR